MLAKKQKRTKQQQQQQQQYKNCFGSATCKELLNTKLSSINCANFTIKFISLMSLKNDDLIVTFLKLSKLLPMSTDFVMNCSFSDSKTCSISQIKRLTSVRLMQSHHNRHYSNEIIFITNFETVYTSIIILTETVLITTTITKTTSCCYGSPSQT